MAKKNEAKVKFTADTKEYTQAMQDSDRETRQLRAELKLNSAELKANADSINLLKDRQKLLEAQLEENQKKQEALNGKLEKAKEIYGDNSNEVKSLTKQVTDAKTAEQNLKNAISDVSEEIETNTKNLGLNEEQLEKVKSGWDNLGNSAGAVAAGIGVIGVSSTMSAIDQEMTLSRLQAQLGLTNEEMASYESMAQNVYDGGYGEGMEDVANAIAEIRYQLGELNDTEHQVMTKNALTLQDVFDMDVKESTRAVNSMVKQFGIAPQEAYNLIVQGARKGLNQNGDLLDTINEYSVQFKNAGYSADDMLNMLANGAESGTWSIDKLGDAVKEMNIRFSDGTIKDALAENRKALGLSKSEVEALQEEFSKGGESAQVALNTVMEHLSEVDDETTRYNIGVSMFGTMWEDLGENTVKSLVDTRGEIDKTNQAMNDVDSTVYDTVGNDIKEAKRQFEEFGRDLLEEYGPEIQDLAEWAVENSDEIIEGMKTIGVVAGTVFAVNKVSKFATSLSSLITTTKNVSTAIVNATTSQNGFNLAQLANPVGITVAAMTGLVAVAYAVSEADKAAMEAEYGLNEAQETLISTIDKRKESVDSLAESQTNETATIDATYAPLESYLEQLEDVVDEEGKIIEGKEEQAEVISTILSEALGAEIELTDLSKESYKNLREEIEKTIDTKRAEAMLDSYTTEYQEAYKNMNEDQRNFSNAQAEYVSAKKVLDDLDAEITTLYEEFENANWWDQIGLSSEIDQKYVERGVAAETVDALKAAMDESERLYLNDLSVISNYEQLQASLINGSTDEVNNALSKLRSGFITAENATSAEALEQQITDLQAEYLQKAADFKAGMVGITEESVNESLLLVAQAQTELANYYESYYDAGKDNMEGFAQGAKDSEETVVTTVQEVADNILLKLPTEADGKELGALFATGFGNGISSLDQFTTMTKDLINSNTLFVNPQNATADQSSFDRNVDLSVGLNTANDLLRDLCNKDFGVYMDGYKVSSSTASTRDMVDATRNLLKDRGVAIE